MQTCKKRLGALWFGAAGILTFMMIFQSMGQIYGDKLSEAWGWFLPTLMPTLSLMCATFIADAGGRTTTAVAEGDPFMFWLTASLSLAYLLMIALTLLWQPIASVSPLELMKQANLWMGPFQGLVSGSLGVFFLKARR